MLIDNESRMSRSGLLIGVGLLALATAALGSTEPRTEPSTARGKIAVYDNTRTVVIVSAATGRVVSKIQSDSIAGTGSPGRLLDQSAGALESTLSLHAAVA